MKDDTKAPVIVVFRKWPKSEGGDVLALFPYEIEDNVGNCLSYQHIGQHGAANYGACIARTKPAKPEEYAQLKAELEQIGYVLTIRKRRIS